MSTTNFESLCSQALDLYNHRYYRQAAQILSPAARADHADSQNLMGLCCYALEDYESAAMWYEKAARQGHAKAQCNLAGCCLVGEGVGRSVSQAKYWFRQAADQGDSFALDQLAMLEEDEKQPPKTKVKTEVEVFGDATMEYHADVLVKYSGKAAEVVVPDHIRVIGKDAFRDCKHLRSIRLPAGLTRIDDQAFFNCGALETVEIPDTVTYIGFWCFKDCVSLRSVHLPAALEKLETQAFGGCDSLKTVTVPGSLKKPANGFEWSSLEEVEFESGVEAIHMDMFWGCRNLKTLIVPDTVRQLLLGPNSPKHSIRLRAGEAWKKANPWFFSNTPFYSE